MSAISSNVCKIVKTIANSVRKTHNSARLLGFDAPTVWSEFTPLSNKHKSCNLGQGFPDWESPDFVKQALIKSILDNHNQYCRSGGEPALVQALSNHYSPILGRTIDPLTEITTSVGATEAIFAIMQALVNPGDEVIVFEPAFDIYPAQVQMAGGLTKSVPLELDPVSKKWMLNVDKLEASINEKTKILLINTPHNPTGKVFTESELKKIADIVRKNPHVIVVMDEVYEKLVYDGKKHTHFASLPDMWDRTLTVSSVGKTFSCTGWKVGWVYGHQDLIKPVMLTNQWVQFSVSTPTQRAIVTILEQADQAYKGFNSYYDWINDQYQNKRNHLIISMRAGNIEPIIPEGGFFIIGDTSKHDFPDKYVNTPGPKGEYPVTRDWGFARWLTEEKGITPIPPSAFYTDETKYMAHNHSRFAFCKTSELLDEARIRFTKLGNNK